MTVSTEVRAAYARVVECNGRVSALRDAFHKAGADYRAACDADSNSDSCVDLAMVMHNARTSLYNAGLESVAAHRDLAHAVRVDIEAAEPQPAVATMPHDEARRLIDSIIETPFVASDDAVRETGGAAVLVLDALMVRQLAADERQAIVETATRLLNEFVVGPPADTGTYTDVVAAHARVVEANAAIVKARAGQSLCDEHDAETRSNSAHYALAEAVGRLIGGGS